MPTQTKPRKKKSGDDIGNAVARYWDAPANLGGVMMTRGEWYLHYRNDEVPNRIQDERTGFLLFCHDQRMDREGVQCRKCNDQGWFIANPNVLEAAHCACCA